MKQIRTLIYIFTYLITLTVTAQESLTKMQVNPILAQKHQQLSKINTKAALKLRVPVTIDTLQLPFLDDFSISNVFPDSTRWIDRSVFVNRTFPIAPPTLGVATFDGLDSTGYPYDFTSGALAAGEADHLTSFPINLYNYQLNQNSGPWVTYTAIDSVYLSFFYQAGGRGAAPDPADSLVLEFRRCFVDTIYTTDSTYNLVDTCIWQHQWSMAGYTPVYTDTNFHAVIINIDTSYFQNGFQFRFRNYAHLNANLDQWHIDYVYLNRNRNHADTIFSDVAFAYNPSSLLKNYQAMPWEQYKPSELRDTLVGDTLQTLRTYIRNNDTIQRNTYFNYQILDSKYNNLSNYGPYSINIQPFSTSGYCNYTPFVKPPLNYTIPLLTDSAQYIFKSYISSNPDFDHNNDTVIYYQNFYNYYAYDDGTAEAGYFLSSTGGNPEFAMRYTLNIPDTLKAIEIYFNPIITNASLFFFRPAIWADAHGQPGALFYHDSVVTPIYGDTIVGGFNQFTKYKITNPALVIPAGTYYFGWQQLTSDPLNVGFDMNTDASSNSYINVSGYWQQSILTGTVMLRPMFRGNILFPASIQPLSKPTLSFTAFPNPTNNQITIQIQETPDQIKSNNTLTLLDIYGQTINTYAATSATTISVKDLSPGIYLLKISDKNQNTAVQRFVKY